jgi:hypothetical protein
VFLGGRLTTRFGGAGHGPCGVSTGNLRGNYASHVVATSILVNKERDVGPSLLQRLHNGPFPAHGHRKLDFKWPSVNECGSSALKGYFKWKDW